MGTAQTNRGEREVKVWKVCILCYAEGMKAAARRWFLVEADTREAAIDVALTQADSTADSGKRWLSFEWREVAPVRFPMEISV